MSDFETVIYEKEGALAHVTLNRPRVLNVFSVMMRNDLYEVLSAIKADDEVKAVIVKGAGEKAFCAGADLSEFLTAPSVMKARRIRGVRDLWRLFVSMPQPLVAALHGYVLGSGMEIALFCDIRIAAYDVVFGLPEMSLGIIPGAGGTQTLPRIMGLSRSLDMLLTGRRIEAAEALNAGLVTRLVPREQLLDEADRIATQIANCDVKAVRNGKQAIIRGMDMPLEQGLDLEKRLAVKAKSRVRKSRDLPGDK
jgi:enoyl-CoA hydratase/carnithine racemase